MIRDSPHSLDAVLSRSNERNGCRVASVTRHRRRAALHIHVDIVRDIEDYFNDPARRKRELRFVFARNRVAAIVANAKAFAADRVMSGHGPERAVSDFLFIDVRLIHPCASWFFPERFLNELDADDVLAETTGASPDGDIVRAGMPRKL